MTHLFSQPRWVKSAASVFATILKWTSLNIGKMYLILSYPFFAIKENGQENYMGIYIFYQLGVYMNRMIGKALWAEFEIGGENDMKYLGIVKRQNGNLAMPDTFQEVASLSTYEAIQVGGDILLLSAPLDRERMKRIEELTNQSIKEHRKTLEGLSK